MSSETIWKNNSGGNNHSLVFENSALTLTVEKPDGSKWVSEPRATKSSLDEWMRAFENLGPKWNQVPHAEIDEAGDYSDARYAESQSPDAQSSSPREIAYWTVHHINLTTKHLIQDRFEVRQKLS